MDQRFLNVANLLGGHCTGEGRTSVMALVKDDLLTERARPSTQNDGKRVR